MIIDKIKTFRYWPHLITIAILCLAFGAYRFFAYHYTRSDDAYVSANVINIAPLVDGPISAIYVSDNQLVKAGEKLIEIDPRPYAYAMEKTLADLNIAKLNYKNDKLSDNNQVLAAKAIYDKARYLYEHTTILAPADGYISNFNLRRGQYIKTGQGIFALIETQRWWVLTRYRETAIRLIKPGDKAKIMIDMYPGKVFHGHVDSIGWGINRVQSGAVAPSTLAYLEATEDWIKIAQRFPVRIYIDDLSPEYPLRVGASATTITYSHD